jgi:hypothetical protein
MARRRRPPAPVAVAVSPRTANRCAAGRPLLAADASVCTRCYLAGLTVCPDLEPAPVAEVEG